MATSLNKSHARLEYALTTRRIFIKNMAVVQAFNAQPATLFVALGSLAGSAWAQSDYPVKPVKIVVGFPEGGGTDVFARALA